MVDFPEKLTWVNLDYTTESRVLHFFYGEDMVPILFTIDSFEVSSYLVFLILGVMIFAFLIIKEGKRDGITNYQIATFIVGIIPFSYAMGVVNGWLFNLDFYRALRYSRVVLYGGLGSFGAILGSLLMARICAKQFRLATAMILDLIVPAWPLVFGFLRIGCLLNGCCHGLETDGVLGVTLPGELGEWSPRYPTQIMLSFFNFALFAWLWPRRRRTTFEGELTLNYLMLYSLGRLAIDAFRTLPRVLGPFSLHQLTSMVILLVSGIIYFKMKRLPNNSSKML